jgi:hypothetical protein
MFNYCTYSSASRNGASVALFFLLLWRFGLGVIFLGKLFVQAFSLWNERHLSNVCFDSQVFSQIDKATKLSGTFRAVSPLALQRGSLFLEKLSCSSLKEVDKVRRAVSRQSSSSRKSFLASFPFTLINTARSSDQVVAILL